jgi:ABC-2 type transport system permease protein
MADERDFIAGDRATKVGRVIRNIAPEVVDILAQVRLEVLRNIRGPRFLVLGVGIPLAIYVAYLVTGIAGATDQPIGGIALPSHLMVSMAAFGAMNAAVGVAAGSWREASAASPSAMTRATGVPDAAPSLLVRAVSAMVLALPPLIQVGLAAALVGVSLPAADWLVLAASLWLGAIPFVALGLLLGAMLDADTRDVVLVGMLVVLAILGGLFQPIETLPPGLAGVAHVLPSYRLADLGWTALADRTVNPADVLVLAAYTLGLGAVVVWRKRTEDAQVGE